MKRILSTMRKRGGSPGQEMSGGNSIPQGDSPEAVTIREVTAFCESGGPNQTGEDYIHLPAIVDAVESSPTAAREAANSIRNFISKDYSNRGYAQYNAIMLTRILTDNPAKTFTKNIDPKFVTTVKELLRHGRDMSVQQILRETLDYFEAEKLRDNDTLGPLIEMWRKEKSKNPYSSSNTLPAGRVLNAPPFGQFQPQPYHVQQQQQQSYFARPQRAPRGLPPPEELAARIEEARTTARLLLQTIQSTPSSKLFSNDLIKEFADRASSASRSIQSYMSCEDPPPDEDVMLTLIETNEQLSIAMTKHQRAVLQARKEMGASSTPPMNGSTPHASQNILSSPPLPPPRANGTDLSVSPVPRSAADETARSHDYGYPSQLAPPSSQTHPMPEGPPQDTQSVNYGVAENPFADTPSQQHPPPDQKSFSLFDQGARNSPPAQDGLQEALQPQSRYLNHERSQRPTGPYNEGYQTTPSYIDRQETATDHTSMHGTTKPPDQSHGVASPPTDPTDHTASAGQGRYDSMYV